MSTTTTNKEEAELLSDYERIRAQNIERNNARLRSLGLISIDEERESNALAWKKKISTARSTKNQNDDIAAKENYCTTKTKTSSNTKKRKRQLTSSSSADNAGRKSLRLQGKQPDGIPVPVADAQELAMQRRARVQECREVRLRRALEISEQGAQRAAKENPTASYGHCLMRVRSMTEKGLANRVKVIERAAGKHCVVKMAIFKSCLQDEGMWDLAELAGEALERLKALKSPES